MSAQEINFRISSRIQREFDLYRGDDLDDQAAEVVIEDFVSEWNEAGDMAFFAESPMKGA